ncbi:MAG: DUF1016 domain-containing protein [Alkalinema sp. RU_4_3]|nr:DUF1016 domain-containing protein [Alkalinema sp. RU_4_3]
MGRRSRGGRLRGFRVVRGGRRGFGFRGQGRSGDQATIGLLLCKQRDRLVAEWALSDVHKPIGISEYHITHDLPEEVRSSLPSIEEIEAELGG